MMDFENAKFLKLKPVDVDTYAKYITPMFAEGEYVIQCFRGIRDGVVFTNKRLIAINIQGVTGMKKDFTSLPYKRIQTFSVETAGGFDIDSELDLWFSGMGRVRFEFVARANVSEICRVISENYL